jgi:hypothetical protein
LLDGILVQVAEAKFNEGPVLLEELWDIEVLPAFIRLLIEIDRPDAILIVFDIRRDVDYEVIRSHVSQQADKAAFVEFDKLFGEPDLVGLGIVDEIFDEQVSGNAGDMFFDQRVEMGEVGDAVWREKVFELQAIDAGSIGLLDIIVIVVVVELVDDADAKGVGVGEVAIVDPGYVEVFGIA